MKKIIKFAVVFIALTIITCLTPLNTQTVYADEQDLFTTGTSLPPNVLIILDNSQSMDEDLVGNAVSPYRTNSKLVEAKRVMQAIVNKYANSMRIGLMTYRLPGVAANALFNSAYFASYDQESYCPNPPDECVDYCKTGNSLSKSTCTTACQLQNPSFNVDYFDEIITYGSGPQKLTYCGLIYPKTVAVPNPTDVAHSIYYKQALPYYVSNSNTVGNEYDYASGYPLVTPMPEAPGLNQIAPGNSYQAWSIKTGVSDGYVGYSGTHIYDGAGFRATDSDFALGYRNFGRRMFSYWVGKTWFANSSLGDGYLHRVAATNPTDNTQLNALLAKLDMKEGNEAAYMTCGTGNTCPYIVNAGLTPIAGTLQSAINYFKGTLSNTNSYMTGTPSPITDNCQKNFVILVTDGLPSVSAANVVGSAAVLKPEVLSKIDALRVVTKTIGSTTYTFNILTYVVGMGLTPDAKSYLDDMAAHGGTAVDGKALYADDTAAIATALDNVFADIVSRSYSFSTSSISSSRTADENYIYEATFEPVSNDQFWKGYLKKWSLKTDGTLNAVIWEAGAQLNNKSAADRNIETLIGGSLVNFKSSDIDTSTPVSWEKMQGATVTDQVTANKVIKYIRGYATDPIDGATVINPDNWKLGDIFHSSPITLGTPSPLFYDIIDANHAFDAYRADNIRESSSGGKRMVIVGANDGQFHAFTASNGAEFWSFIPPNLLPKLQYLAHYSNPTANPHIFYVDGTTTATDAWLPATPDDGSAKNKADWKTLVMFSLGRNDRDYTTAADTPLSTKYWSSSASCDTGTGSVMYETYHATSSPYYCGYYAFDFTAAPTSDPIFKWTLQPTATEAPFLGEPWSAISTGRVRIAGNERWIGVIGGGYDAADCSVAACTGLNKRGKGIIVFDLRNGQTIWRFTHDHTSNPNMDYSIPSQVSLVDSDNDGFIDHSYFGDLKGNMWQLKFCTKADLEYDANCGTSSWSGSLLLDKITGSNNYPIYYPPAVTRDRNGDLWVFWGTGDKVDPTGSNPAASVYGLKALKCNSFTGEPPVEVLSPCVRSNLANITSTVDAYCTAATSKKGWVLNLAGTSEKVLAQLTAFNSVLYFTSFVPAAASSAECTATGTAYLYALSIETSTGYCTAGQGKLDSGGTRSKSIGTGIASGVTISFGPGAVTPGMYYTISGAGGQEGGTKMDTYSPSSTPTKGNLLYWKDRRLE